MDDNQTALYNPDQVVGGDLSNIGGMKNEVNSFLGA